MMYPFMTLDDETEVVHSETLYDDNNQAYVRVYFERPVDNGFQSAECRLPDYIWVSNDGFTEDEITRLQNFTESVAHIILELAQSGGFDNAANF